MSETVSELKDREIPDEEWTEVIRPVRDHRLFPYHQIPGLLVPGRFRHAALDVRHPHRLSPLPGAQGVALGHQSQPHDSGGGTVPLHLSRRGECGYHTTPH